MAMLLATSTINAQTLQATLTASNYNGYNISCFGMQNGSVTATVTGGMPPYIYEWSNGETTATLSGLAAGYYMVRISDSAGEETTAQITLTQPEPLSIDEMKPYVYPNGYHISAYGACNGSITTNIKGGVLPYSYLWEPSGQTVLSPTNLCAYEAVLKVTDVNGCQTSSGIGLSEPQRDDWTMSGNWGSNPATHFIGTNDNKDLVFKTNGAERMRINSGGLSNFSGDLNLEQSLIFKNNRKISFYPASTGIPDILSFGTLPNTGIFSIANCNNPIRNTSFVNQFNGTIQLYGSVQIPGNPFSTLSILEMGFDGYNSIIESSGYTPAAPDANRLLLNYYCGRDVIIGNNTSGDLTASQNLLVNGKLGIGISQQDLIQTPAGYKLIVEGKIGAREVRIVNNNVAWPDYVFDKKYKLKTLSETEKYFLKNQRLPGFPNADEIQLKGQDIGNLQILQQEKIEELYLHLIALEKRLTALERENKKLKALKEIKK
jgi:hypothetical protein